MDSTAGVTYLVNELTDIKATVRALSLDPEWLSLVGLLGSWTGPLAWSFVSSSSAAIQGDQRAYFKIGDSVQVLQTGAPVFGTVTAATFAGGVTTITISSGFAINAGITDMQPALDLSNIITQPYLIGVAPTALIPYATTSGGDAYTATIAGLTAIKTGQNITVRFNTPNTTTSPTLNINSLGAANIFTQEGTNVAVGQLLANTPYQLWNDGFSWYLMNDVSANHGFQTVTYADFTGGLTSFTVPPGVTRMVADIYGAGGGGGGGGTGTNACGGAGGSDGSHVKVIYTGMTPGASLAIVIGAGGALGIGGSTSNAAGNAGAAGGSTSFSGITAAGGGGGAGGVSAGVAPGSPVQSYNASTIPNGVVENETGHGGANSVVPGVGPGGGGGAQYVPGGNGGAGVASGAAPSGTAGANGYLILTW